MNKQERKISFTNQFKKDLKIAKKQGKNIALLFDIIKKLANDIPLNINQNDHKLKGKLKGLRECHITPDWLLVYEKPDKNILFLIELGSHSRLNF